MDSSRSGRPFSLKARQDLVHEYHMYQGRESVVVKDPLALKYFRFEPEEFAILQMLDGRSTALEIKQKFDRKFAPQKLTFSELQQFAGMLHRNGLLLANAPGQGIELHKRRLKNDAARLKQSWMSLMAFRFRGFDPDWMLGFLNAIVGWIFSRWAFGFVCLLFLAAGSLIFTNFESFQSKLPHFRDFFAGENWLLLGIVLGVTKIIHEIGHGLACKRFGGECHEMGFMLLVFMPCLYCNVTDSWLLSNKWKRIAISAAGIYFELILASLATFVWWYSLPGVTNQLALNVMFVCSVSTLMFNANPLMRYDGYYILSDWLEIPNLRQKANRLLNQTVNSWLLGVRGRSDRFLPTRQQWLFVTFSVASFVYRWVVTISIFWFLYKVLEPHGLKILGQMLAVMTLGMAIGVPLIAAVRYFSVPGRWQAVNRFRLAVTGVIAGGLIVAILAIPLPHYVNCWCYVQAAGSESIYVEVPGAISEVFVEPGETVVAGDPLVNLTNADISSRILEMEREEKIAQAHFKVVNYVTKDNPEAAAVLSPREAEAAWQSAQAKLNQRRRDLERLQILSPRTGVFVPAPPRKSEPDEEGILRTWVETPVAKQNIGALLESQTLIGQIVPDPRQIEVVLAVDQSEIEFIQASQPVRIWIRELPGCYFEARTTQISPTKMKAVPPQLSTRHGEGIQTVPGKDQTEEPFSSTFQVNVPLKWNETQPVLLGATGIAKVRVGNQTIGSRLWRLACQTFRFEM